MSGNEKRNAHNYRTPKQLPMPYLTLQKKQKGGKYGCDYTANNHRSKMHVYTGDKYTGTTEQTYQRVKKQLINPREAHYKTK